MGPPGKVITSRILAVAWSAPTQHLWLQTQRLRVSGPKVPEKPPRPTALYRRGSWSYAWRGLVQRHTAKQRHLFLHSLIPCQCLHRVGTDGLAALPAPGCRSKVSSAACCPHVSWRKAQVRRGEVTCHWSHSCPSCEKNGGFEPSFLHSPHSSSVCWVQQLWQAEQGPCPH